MAFLHWVIRWVPLTCSICFTSKGKSFQLASIFIIKAIGCTARKESWESKRGRTYERPARFYFFFYGSQHSGKTNDGHYLNHLHALVRVCVSLSDDGGAAWITDITLGILLTEVVEVANLANMAHRMCTKRLRFGANAVRNKQEQICDNSSTVLSEKRFSCLIWVFSRCSLKSQLLSVVVGFLHLLKIGAGML